MDDLPPSLILEILTRLNDSADLARCRVASKTFNAVSHDVRAINLLCTLPRYLKSRSAETKPFVTPFKNIVNNLVFNSRCSLQSISIGVEKTLGVLSFDDVEDESDDLYLTDIKFVKEWLVQVQGELKSLSISDFWLQSCWRKSEILGLISSSCHGLLELELKNAWLSVDGLIPMRMLTSLTLEFVRLDDEDLNKVNNCFPCLQVLNLIGVGGLKEPKVNLVHLKSCRWTVSNAPLSLGIYAPNLVKLELKCSKPRSLVLETPMLFDFYLSVEKANKFEVKEFCGLNSLRLESANLFSLIRSFPYGILVKRLTVDSLKCTGPVEMTMLTPEALFDVFPNVRSITLRSGAWSEMETCFLTSGLQIHNELKGLKEITAQLVIHDVEITFSFISCLFNKCPNLSAFALLFHCEMDPNVARILLVQCTANHPSVRWKWGTWKEGTEDNWDYNVI